MLISVHIPKAAGTSLSLNLQLRFGDGYLADYNDGLFNGESSLARNSNAASRALELNPSKFAGVACVHGHFLPFKYSLLAEQMTCTFVTWLREPVDRLISQYYYWKQYYEENGSFGHPPTCVAENWSFERFCFCDEFRNMQSKFIWGVPLSTFEFVGLTEHYSEDFARFSRKYLGGETEPAHVNVTHTKPSVTSIDVDLRTRIQQFHAQDMALYQAAVARRNIEVETERRLLDAQKSVTTKPETRMAAPGRFFITADAR